MGLKTARKQTTAHGQSGARGLVRPFALFYLRRTGQAFERALHLALQLAMGWLTTLAPAHAAPFIIVNGQTATTTQVVGAGETGTVEAGGTISTAVADTYGIDSSGDNATINNSGSINTTGDRAYGINSTGFGVAITNSGSISTTGLLAVGIVSTGGKAFIANSGSISTMGDHADGVVSNGDQAFITNSGSMGTAGDHAFGINSSGFAVSIRNSGSIVTKGVDAIGIYTDNHQATIINSGRISTTGNGGVGIEIFELDSVVTNSGKVSTTGIAAHGIVADSANSTIINSGLVSVQGSGSFAILGGGTSNQTLNLLPGSRIRGAIDLGGGGDTVNISGSYGSAVLSFANAGTINVLTTNAVRLGASSTVVIIDPTGESSRAQSLSALSSGIHHAISQRQQSAPEIKPAKLATLELSPGMLHLETAPVVWGQVLGSQSRREGEGQMLSFAHRYAGLIGGYEQDDHGDRIGLVAGIANGNTSSAMTSMNSDGIFAGLYRLTRHGELDVTASVVAGIEMHNNRRTLLDNLNGLETASGTTTSYYLSPSLSAGRSYPMMPNWVLRPSATLSYSVGWYAGYTESGTANANLSLNSRTVQALAGRAQLEFARQISSGEASMRAGVQTRQTSDGAIQGMVGGSDFRFSAMGSKSVAGGYVGLGVRQALRQQLSLLADVEYGQLSGNETQVSARVSMQYLF